MTQLLLRLNGIHKMSDELIDYLKRHLQRKSFEKDELILRKGQICRHVYFIEKGLIHIFTSDESSENTTWLLRENDIAISYESFFEQTSSRENLVALESTILWFISHDQLENACQLFPEFKDIREKIKDEYRIKKEDNDDWLGRLGTLERYKYLLAHDPELIRRVEIPQLASYLRMSTKRLYRIKNEINNPAGHP